MPGTVIRNHPRHPPERAGPSHEQLQHCPYQKLQEPGEAVSRDRQGHSHPALRLGLALVLFGLLFAIFTGLARLAVLPAPPPVPEGLATQEAARPS